MQLNPAPKVYGEGIHRVTTPEKTFRRIKPLMGALGITRLADITGLDYCNIPTYSAVVPASHDILSIYNGKGTTKIQAKVGAVMEAAERHAASHLRRDFIYATYQELSETQTVLDPQAMRIALHPYYDKDKVLAWMEGFDLLQQCTILVPAELVGYNISGQFGHVCYALSSTNGLASGNTLEEAICHALCELIERDAWTIAELLSHWLPLARYQNQSQHLGQPTLQKHTKSELWDDVERYPNIDIEQTTSPIRTLVQKFRRAGLKPLIKNITSDLGIPTILVTIAEQAGPALPRAHFGLGTHPDVRVALIRALTEVAQSRAVDIQGVREDIALSGEQNSGVAHTKRVSTINRRSWYHLPSPHVQAFVDIPTYPHGDVREDIYFMSSRLRDAGLEQIIVVDVTEPEIGIPVVRVLVPGLECWSVDRTQIGQRALQQWQIACMKEDHIHQIS